MFHNITCINNRDFTVCVAAMLSVENMARPGFELMTSRSEVHHANHYTIEASYKKGQIFYVEVYNVLLFCEVKIEMPVTYNEWILQQ